MRDFWDKTGAFGLRILAAVLGVMPGGAASALARAAGACAFQFNRRKRVAYADLKAAFGARYTEKERWQIVKRHYQHLAQAAVEILRLPVLSKAAPQKIFSSNAPETFYKALDKGGIFLTAHFGNWELLQLYARSKNREVLVLAREQKMARMNQIVTDIRERAGFHVTETGMGIRGLLRSLKKKELVGLLGDQDSGKHGGVILRFLGRKTTVPTGAFDLAFRAGVPAYPMFMGRRNSETFYDIHVYPGIEMKTGSPEEVEKAAAHYVSLLEKEITEKPEQWLWAVKRWKYSWTKRILILSDGKPGHVKQSEGVAAQFQTIDSQYGRPGMEYPVETLQVKFKSGLHRFLFPWFALVFLPFAQGNLGALKLFFEKETAEKIAAASADFIISAGSSLTPLNLCVARDNRAKSIVILKPVFPFHLFKYDLALIPAHDQGLIPEKAMRILLAPARMDTDGMEASAAALAPSLRDPERIRWSVFWGGTTRKFRIGLEDTKKVFFILDKVAEKLDGDYAVTTSRRTSEEGEKFFKDEVSRAKACQLMVVAREDSRREVVPGMMALGQVLIVTEDSVSMISEAIRSGRKVIVLKLDSAALPSKHRRFHQVLSREAGVTLTDIAGLEAALMKQEAGERTALADRENEILKKKLQEIL